MQVYVDEQPVECAVAQGDTVAALIERVRGMVVSADRLVVGVTADGDDITGESFADTLVQKADAFQRYEFTTGDPHTVVLDALSASQTLLDSAEETRVRVIERLTQGNAGEGLAALGECCSAWRQVHETIASAMHLLKLDSSSLQIAGRSVPDSLADMKPPLSQIRAALDARDFVLVSDVLQYEFEPVVQNWRSFIAAIQQAT